MLKHLVKLLFPLPKLARTQQDFDKQADEFLAKHGFPVNAQFRRFFGTLVQHSDDGDDTFNPKAMAKRIRKAQAVECAFYLIHPERRPKEEAAPSEQKEEPTIDTEKVGDNS